MVLLFIWGCLQLIDVEAHPVHCSMANISQSITFRYHYLLSTWWLGGFPAGQEASKFGGCASAADGVLFVRILIACALR